MNSLCPHDQKILDSIANLCEVKLDKSGERILIYKGLQFYYGETYCGYRLFSSNNFGQIVFDWDKSKNKEGQQLKKPRTNVKKTVEDFEKSVMEQVLNIVKNPSLSISFCEMEIHEYESSIKSLRKEIENYRKRKEVLKKKFRNILTEEQLSQI